MVIKIKREQKSGEALLQREKHPQNRNQEPMLKIFRDDIITSMQCSTRNHEELVLLTQSPGINGPGR
jgi:hypothetical protein